MNFVGTVHIAMKERARPGDFLTSFINVIFCSAAIILEFLMGFKTI